MRVLKFKNTVIAISLLALCGNLLFAQNENTQVAVNQKNHEIMLDAESALFKVDIPLKQGIEEFSARIEKVRQEENREPLGLILCGGSARAFCHTGVLRAMEENQIRPDFIVANSMGAIIGLLYAYGFSPAKIEEIISNLSLASYFDLVAPLHGGLINVRKYEAIVNQLLADESHDVKDCDIPVLILAEDLYSKRQVWYAAGDFSTVMNSAFSMPVFMEPVKDTLQDGTQVYLTDAGTLDIGGMKVAETFSDNLIISTAFYDKKLNYNSAIVVINRTTSIGKERIAIGDIKKYNPVVIRNDVEHFSFMEFDKANEIGLQGYKSANLVMDKILELPHGFKLDAHRRKVTDSLADQLIFNVQHQVSAPIARPYFGVKIRPIFSQTDFNDFYVYKHDGILLCCFEDLPYASLKAGLAYPFGTKAMTSDIYYKFSKNIWNGNFMTSYNFDFENLSKSTLYGAGKLGFSPNILPSFIKEFYATGEYFANAPINLKENRAAYATKYTNFTLGFNLDLGNPKKNYFNLKPYGFISGPDFANLSYGAGGELKSNLNIFKYFGIGESASCRYAFGNFNKEEMAVAPLFFADFFRDSLPDADRNLSLTSASEIYFIKPDCTLTFAEFLIMRQIKLGGFYDLAYTSTYHQCAGGFLRTEVSFIGLTDFIIEGGCGWNFNNQKVFGYFSMKNRM